MHRLTLAQLIDGLQKKDFSSVELTQHYLNRIATHNETLNAFISVLTEPALAAARAADATLAAGDANPLTGIPIAQKDNFCTQGVPTTCASKMLDNFISPYDATVVTRCHDAGMVMLGKTNMDEFAMGSSNENSFFGPVRNPWQHDKVPGGSSGGSAAAVAARLTPAATGTDTGGSIRQPAAFCGISGLKPTYGRVSRWGMVAFASSLDQGGPMAASVEDLAYLMSALAGHDPKDSTSALTPVADYVGALEQSIKGIKIGLPSAWLAEGLAPEILAAVEKASQTFADLGAEIIEIDIAHTNLSVPTYYTVAPAECSSNLARFDGVRYGYRCEAPKNLLDLYTRTRDEGFGPEVKRRIMMGTFALSSGYYDAFYIKAQKIRQLISNEYKKVFKAVDVILGPTTPAPAFGLGEKVDDPMSMYLADLYTIPNNLAGFPGLAIPAGFMDGLPIGIQISGNYFAEAQLLNLGHQFQKATDWHLQIPDTYAL